MMRSWLPLPEEHAQISRDRVVFGDDLRHLVADFGVSLLHGAPEFAELLLAVAGAHVRQHVDRRVGEEVDVFGAARQRGLEIAVRDGVEQMQHALAIELLDRHSARPHWPWSLRKANARPRIPAI